ncbi:AAA family ATPase [Aureimonas leprariae]|uniref:AAA family ATPase n=1 Tax=Plantimonas leprariae TaxID=2615207 RepID=A0A7V7U223_9HYPH|nr:AAA family ATPase [Aureimonas leprariae]KAB0682913.1 AAA family ATPase [Aureimonas leprariae]
MGRRNYLINGVSGTGKTAVANELQRRGHQVIHGDRDLAYAGDPRTGEPIGDRMREYTIRDAAFVHGHHLWDVGKVELLAADRSRPVTFFCGGARNFHRFIDLFDAVFVLDVDLDTLNERLAARPEDEFGGKPDERALIVRLHATQEDVPKHAARIDATGPLSSVVDEILSRCTAIDPL